DGVPDTQDRCPATAGPARNGGCPEISVAARQSLRDATRAIQFARNSAILLPASYPTLDALVPLLAQYPDYSLSIVGHTDSQGPAAFNLSLSRERAAAARTYLLDKGVTAGRVELRGYGALHPIATNATEAGRSRNRRVEFDLFVSNGPSSAQKKYGAEPAKGAVKAPVKKAPVKKAPVRKASGKKAPAASKVVRKPAAPKTVRTSKAPAVKRPAPARPTTTPQR
ncbi:OmpA family protein, partial [Hymenobacter persicinus]